MQLSVQSGQGNSVDIVTGVAQPGVYPLPDRNSTILSLLAQAGVFHRRCATRWYG